MNRLLFLAAWRFYRQHPGQLLLALAGIALGVAVVVAVDLASGNALRAFETSSRLVTARSSHIVRGPLDTMTESTYRVIKVEAGISAAAPVVEGSARIGHSDGESVRILGVDLLGAGRSDAGPKQTGGSSIDIARLIAVPGTVLLPEEIARRIGVGGGDTLTLYAAGAAHLVTVLAVIDPASNPLAGTDSPIVTDIATAQELLGRIGSLSRIEVDLDPAGVAALTGILPPGVTLEAAGARDAAVREMLGAFRINLSALSLLALVVGVLLIYATMSFAIVRRRRSLGTLRALGVTRVDILRAVLLEALVMGLVATLAGLVLGQVLSGTLIELVLESVNNLYFATRVLDPELAVMPFIKAAVVGLLATLLAAIGPALSAAREVPLTAISRIAYEQRVQGYVAKTAPGALALAALAVIFIAWPGGGLLLAFAGLFLVLAAYGLSLPRVLGVSLRAIQPAALAGFGLPASLAVRGAATSLSRTSVAVTALAIAVATVIGIGLMIGSFRASVSDWLDSSLLADYYLLAHVLDQDDGFSHAELETLHTLPGVAGLSTARTVSLHTAAGALPVRVATAGPKGYGEKLIAGDTDAALKAIAGGSAILIAEPYANRAGLTVGDSLQLPGPHGTLAFRIAGVYRSYQTNNSAALLPADVFRHHWNDIAPTGVGVYLADVSDAAAVRAALEQFVAARGHTRFAANGELRERTLEVFDRTFAITGVLRTLAGIIAFFGILSALLALQLERTREVATLRAIGFSEAQIRVNALVQTSLLGLLAGLFALPLGIVLALLLIFVINRRSFGWSMDFVIAPGDLLWGVALALAAAILAGVYPALRLSTQPIARHLRSE